MPWTTLASRYENLLKEKKEVNSKIQSEGWAYRAALEKIEKRKDRKNNNCKLIDRYLSGMIPTKVTLLVLLSFTKPKIISRKA